MNFSSKQIKLIAGVALLGGAFALGMGPAPEAPKLAKVKKGPKTPETVGLVDMTYPTDEKNFGEGTYVFEGQIGKHKKVQVLFDDRDPVTMDADSDGAYRYEAQKVKAGEHKIVVKVSDTKDKNAKPETEELGFKVSKAPQKEVVAKADPKSGAKVAKADDDELPANLLPNDDGSDVAYTKSSDLGADDVAKKDSVVEKEAHSAPEPKNPAPTKAHTTKHSDIKVAPKPAGKFVISSHTNFNVVPHGVIKVGGKGNPGDKIMLLVDGKPSMRGTVKADGRWNFPVKVSMAGFRKITAQNLKSRQIATVKLKIK